MGDKKVEAPLTAETVKNLKAGDGVLLSGVIYTARDAAHKRLVDLIGKGEELPFDPEGSVIYYVGPSPAPPGPRDRRCRTDDEVQDGRLHTSAFEARSKGDDRQGAAVR